MNNIILNTESDMLLKPEAVHIKSIYSAINDMKGNVFTIGEHLAALKRDIKQLGRDYTVFDVAKQLFNIEKSTVYNYINIYERFNSQYYQNYSLSLLTEFLSLSEHEEGKFTQFSTVADVRKYKASIANKKEQPQTTKSRPTLHEIIYKNKKQNTPDENDVKPNPSTNEDLIIDVESKEDLEYSKSADSNVSLDDNSENYVKRYDLLHKKYMAVKINEENLSKEYHQLQKRHNALAKYQEEYRVNFDTILDFILFRLDEHYCDPKHKPLEYVHKDVKYIRELQECRALNDYLKEV